VIATKEGGGLTILVGEGAPVADVRLHPMEQDRLDALLSYGVLDTEPEPGFDSLTALAAHVLGTPMAAVTLVDADRQWFKARLGPGAGQTLRAWSFCSDTVAAGAPLVVADTLADPRYRDNPLVAGEPGIRAYAGAPLIGRDGLPLGALCVLDVRPRTFDVRPLELLGALAEQVVVLLEQRRRDRSAGLLEEAVLAEALNPPRLRRALDAGELVPHYQPMVDIVTGHVHGLEALLRWEHPALGTLTPAAFLPVVEASSLIVPVGRAVLDASLPRWPSCTGAGWHCPGVWRSTSPADSSPGPDWQRRCSPPLTATA